MNNTSFFLLLFWFNLAFSQNQKISVTKTNSIAIVADNFIGSDSFNNYYYTKNEVLYKNDNSVVLNYQNLGLGKITKVDLLNPLKIVVFYSDFNTVIILDNQLNEVQKIAFSELETPVIATAVGMSEQNRLWFYNTLNQQIGLYDLVSNKCNSIGTVIRNGITYYETDFNYFEFIDKNNLWNTYTIFGRFFENGTVESALQIQLLKNKKYLVFNGDGLFLKDNNTNMKIEIDIFEKTFKKFYYKDQILTIFTDQGISNYKIIIP